MKNFPLALQLVRRDIAGRYRGSILGMAWSFINPVLMLSVYTFVFGMVFRARWGMTGNRLDFAMTLFSGLIVFNLFSECLTRAPHLILSNVNYVKKVVFPLEILPWVSLGSALFHAGISLFVLFAFMIFSGHHVFWTFFLIPLILLPMLPMILGFSWLLASVGVFVRDVGQFVGMAMTVLLFMSPVFYPASALPASVRPYLFLNPLTFVIEQTRGALFDGMAPDWKSYLVYFLASLALSWAGYFWFRKTRHGFADVL